MTFHRGTGFFFIHTFAVLISLTSVVSAEQVLFLDTPADFEAAEANATPDFGVPFVFSNGPLNGFDLNGDLLGNNVLVMTQLAGTVAEENSVGFTLSAISNGENGIDSTDDGPVLGINDDVPNAEPESPQIETVNGAGNTKLQNGNVVRFSAWVRLDPNFPLDISPAGVPQVEPHIKVEAWKEALSLNQDTDPFNVNPQFGDKIFDQAQHGQNIGIFPADDKEQWIDLGSDGIITDNPDAAPEGRVTTPSESAWTLVETTYEIDDFFWLGIGSLNPGVGVVSAVEEIRATFFFGDFTALIPAPDTTLEAGNILIDNIQVEIFADTASVTANTNPNPSLSDVDFDDDQDVDGDDLDILLNNYGTPGFDGETFMRWARASGQDFSLAQFQALVGIPEPSSAVLVLLAGVLSMSYRQKR